MRISQQFPNYSKYIDKKKYVDKKKEDVRIDDYVYGKDIIEKKLREINENIEVIGKICDRKKQRSYEEYKNVLNSNKAMIEEELSKIRFKLVDALKNSTKEDMLKKLQREFANKKTQVYDTDRELQNKNKVLYDYEHKINKLKEENRFLNQEIKNSHEYQLYLENKLKETEEIQKAKQSSYINISTTEPLNLGNTKEERKTEKNEEESKEEAASKLKKYFSKNEEMLLGKIQLEERIQKEKYVKYRSMLNFKNSIQDIMRNQIKAYQMNQVNQITEKVTNQEIFFSLNDSKNLTKSRLTKSGINLIKKSDFRLNEKEKKEIVKLFLEDEEMKQIIYSFLYE